MILPLEEITNNCKDIATAQHHPRIYHHRNYTNYRRTRKHISFALVSNVSVAFIKSFNTLLKLLWNKIKKEEHIQNYVLYLSKL